MIPRSELSRKTWLSLRFVNLFYVFFSNRRFFCASLAGRTTALAYCGPLGCSSWMGSKSRVQHFDKFASWWSNQPHWHYVLFFSKENSEGTKWNWILTWHPRWWQLKDVLNFHPENSGKWSILTSICFGRGWFNHQLDDSSRPPPETGRNFPVSQGPIWKWKPLRIVLNAKMQALRSANFQHFCSPFSMRIYRSCNKLAFLQVLTICTVFFP